MEGCEETCQRTGSSCILGLRLLCAKSVPTYSTATRRTNTQTCKHGAAAHRFHSVELRDWQRLVPVTNLSFAVSLDTSCWLASQKAIKEYFPYTTSFEKGLRQRGNNEGMYYKFNPRQAIILLSFDIS